MRQGQLRLVLTCIIGHFKTRCKTFPHSGDHDNPCFAAHLTPKCVRSEKLRHLKRRKTNRDEWHKTVVELFPVRSEMHSLEYPRSAHLQSVLQCTRKCASGEGPWFRLKPHARQRQFARRCFFCVMWGKGISTPFTCTLRDTNTPTMCTKNTRSPNLAKRVPHSTISSESHFFILNKPYVFCSVKVDLSPICASRQKAWHLAAVLRKDSDISNTQAWRQTWWRCHLDPNASRHHRSTRFSENNPAPVAEVLQSINSFIVCSKCFGGCHITQQLWTQRTQYV